VTACRAILAVVLWDRTLHEGTNALIGTVILVWITHLLKNA
jgi:hypothetical protein